MPLDVAEQGYLRTQERVPQALSVKVPEPSQRRALTVHLAGDHNPIPVIGAL